MTYTAETIVYNS